jgi:micrococcal nuclease
MVGRMWSVATSHGSWTGLARLMVVVVVLAVGSAAAGCAPVGARPSSPAPSSAASPSSPAASSASTAEDGLRPTGRTETARVVRVVDGDTLVIDRGRGEERLRYIGVDAPESVKPGSPVEFMGREASKANARLVDRATVVLERDVSETDRYGRLLRYVWIRDGDRWRFINLELVREGFARVATFPPDVRWIDTFRDAERVARDAGRGLWGPATPLP